MSVHTTLLVGYVVPLDDSKFDLDEALENYPLSYKSGEFGILYDGMCGDFCFGCSVVVATEADGIDEDDFLRNLNTVLSICKVPDKINELLKELSLKLTGEVGTPRLQAICIYS